MIDRRMVLIGAGATLAMPPRIVIASPVLPFAGTSLVDNPLAKRFTMIDQSLPRVILDGPDGRMDLSLLKGKTRIVTLWAEWCAPCLVEARDFATLRRDYAGPNFDIISILTASHAKLDYASALARLQKAGADGLPLIIEADGGKRVGEAFSPIPGTIAMPCTLVVDTHGRVRARTQGVAMISPSPPMGAIAHDDKGKAMPMVLTQAQKQQLFGADARSTWSGPAGKAFVAGLRDGALH